MTPEPVTPDKPDDESTDNDYAEAERRFDEAQAELLRIREEFE